MDTSNPNRPHDDRGGPDAFIHREILQIGILMLIAVIAFFATQAVAANNRETTLHDAEAWYERGQRLMSAGRLEEAIFSLRRASVRNRYERKYALALANALERNHDTEAAHAALLTLREASPEDAEVNLALARIAAERQDVTEALRFYHNALYAPWPTDSARERRDVRFELIDFLLQHKQEGRALSELFAIAADLPDEPAVHVRVGQLLARAGDSRQALNHYEQALRLAPSDRNALAGAGTTAFTLGDYLQARNYLRRAPADLDDVARTREIVDLVLSSDPLASRIGSAERRRRLAASLDYADERLKGCEQVGAAAGPNSTAAFQEEIASLREQLRLSTVIDQDSIEAGLDLFGRIEQQLAKTCPPMTAHDRALALIARSHATDSK